MWRDAGIKEAIAVVGVLVLIASFIYLGVGLSTKSGFYTGYASEEPTRSYVPYTGTIPYGVWGAKPWTELWEPDMAPLYEDDL